MIVMTKDVKGNTHITFFLCYDKLAKPLYICSSFAYYPLILSSIII